MATQDTKPQVVEAPADAELRALDRLVGTWRVTGGAQGSVTFRWMEGGHFLLQDVDLEQQGGRTTGIEVIGRERGFGASQPSEAIRSRYYDNHGNTLDYVYELSGSRLTIWGGAKGSPAYYSGTFTDGDAVLTGRWVWPGGGYESVMTRVE